MDDLSLNNFSTISADDQIEVIQSFFDIGDHAKALEICNIALKHYPENAALSILKHTILETLDDGSSNNTQSQPLKIKKGLIHRIESIANVFSKTKKTQDAIALYKILKAIDPENFLACFRLGQVHFDHGEYNDAIKEFESALAIDPFHIFTLKKLGLAHYIQTNYFEALQFWMDGLILTIPTHNQEDLIFFQTHIRNAQASIPGFNKSDRNTVFKKRQKRLGQFIHELKNSLPSSTGPDLYNTLDHWFVAEDAQEQEANPTVKKTKSLADLPETSKISAIQDFQKDPDLKPHKSNHELKNIAEKLNQYTVFKNLSHEERLSIANFTSFISLREDAYVFHENEPCYGIYFIERGLVEYSNQSFNLFFSQGQLFGHENILIHEKSMFTAKVKKECDLVFIDKAGLALVFSRNKTLAIHFLWYFWKSLLFQYQELRYILSQYHAATPYIKAKIEHLPSIHLSQKEIHTLNSVCDSNILPENTVLFDFESQPAGLYVVLEGKINLIHKNLTSFVEKGQYFAEIFLADKNLSSSYQAKVIENKSKVIKINPDILQSLTEKDEVIRYDFLTVLCKMYAYKLQTLKKLG